MPRKPKLMFQICQKLRFGFLNWALCFTCAAAMPSRREAPSAVSMPGVGFDVFMVDDPARGPFDRCGPRMRPARQMGRLQFQVSKPGDRSPSISGYRPRRFREMAYWKD